MNKRCQIQLYLNALCYTVNVESNSKEEIMILEHKEIITVLCFYFKQISENQKYFR
jgi:hypothetical protein